MTVWLAALLGLVQGLCEFLPISSSGHLLLLQKMFGIEEGAMFFTVMLHLGTLIAVFIVYWKTILKLLRHPFQKLVLHLVIATVPTVILAMVFKFVPPFDRFYEAAGEGRYLGVCFLFTSVVLSASDLLLSRSKKQRRLSEMRATDALIVGGMQSIGVLSGVSRSGSTISGALFAGLNRKAAADFSFLLSIPAIVGGAVLEIPKAISEGVAGIPWYTVVVGMVVAAVSGYLAIRLMLSVIKKKRLSAFAIYTAILGVLVLLDQFVFHLFF